MRLQHAVSLTIAVLLGTFAFSIVAMQSASAQSAQGSLKQSCADAARAFALRDAGSEELAVADPAASSKLRQAALLFYRCSQREADPYMHDLFLAYYANTLYKLGQNDNDPRASALAVKTAQRLRSSDFDDVQSLVANISVPAPTQATATPTPAPARHSDAYCRDLVPAMSRTLDALGLAVISAGDAGTNDTQGLAVTTARYGSAFKAVEDDYNTVQSNLQTAMSEVATANGVATQLTDKEKTAVNGALQTIGQTISYTDTYTRLALAFERGINGANRRLAWARASQALASGMQNMSHTYSNGTASCYSYTAYSTNCYGNSYSRTTYDNSATVAQQNAANALANAQAGRLSYSQAGSVLAQGLPVLQQIQSAVYEAQASWNKVCHA